MYKELKQRTKRTLIALLLMLTLSFSPVLATDEKPADAAPAEQTSTQEQVQPEQSQTPAPAPAPVVVSNIIKKGKYYYYKDPKTSKIRKTAGFVKDTDGSLYYVKKGGNSTTGKTFKVKKKTYRANSKGKIMTGVYKWGKAYYYSNAKGQWVKGKKLITWKGNPYFIQKNGKILTDKPFSYNDQPYLANASGAGIKLEIPDAEDSEIIRIARAQLGIKTGKKYWNSYFGGGFRNRDATPWCATFVTWVYKQAGVYSKIKGVGNLAYVPSYTRFASRRGKWVKKSEAKPGDIIIFGQLGRHVGLVEGISNGCVITIEGNTVALLFKGGRTPGQVQRKAYKINDKDIRGIMRP